MQEAAITGGCSRLGWTARKSSVMCRLMAIRSCISTRCGQPYGQSLIDGKPFLIGPAVEDELPRLSPDGGWMALPSNESGSVEIIVRPFAPGAAGGTQVSFGGGHDPRWSRDGKELFYRTNDWHVVAVPVVDLKQRRFGKPVSLFRLPDGAEYDVVNGKRFLVNEPVGTATAPLFVIANWRPEQPKSE